MVRVRASDRFLIEVDDESVDLKGLCIHDDLNVVVVRLTTKQRT